MTSRESRPSEETENLKKVMEKLNEISSNLEKVTNGLNDVLTLAVTKSLSLLNTSQTRPSNSNPERNDRVPVLGTADPLPEITLDQVSWHDNCDDCWIVLYDRVYDVTEFLQEHPGGCDVLLEYAGRDATLAYRGFGHSAQAWQILQKYLIGVLPEKETGTFTFHEDGNLLGVNLQLRAASS